METNSGSNTEELIKNTAREVFMQKGMDGARMQDIADKAGINKAMLHYYFRSKEKLFEIIFEEERKNFLHYITQLLESDCHVLEKIEKLIEKQVDNLIKAPYLPTFIIGEILKRPELLETKVQHSPFKEVLQKFVKEVNKEVKNGNLKNTTGEQLILNIFSLDIFPFIGKPFFMRMFDMNEEQYIKMLHKRKKDVVQFIIETIKVEE